MYNTPLAYFITFRTYGTWLHGDERGSIDRNHHTFGAPMLPPNLSHLRFESALLQHPSVELTDSQRTRIDAVAREVCRYKRWELHALNVRTNHVHLVITASATPESVMNTLKAWCTRRMREAGLATAEQRVWSRHGSTIYLFQPEHVAEKIRYVLEGQ